MCKLFAKQMQSECKIKSLAEWWKARTFAVDISPPKLGGWGSEQATVATADNDLQFVTENYQHIINMGKRTIVQTPNPLT